MKKIVFLVVIKFIILSAIAGVVLSHFEAVNRFAFQKDLIQFYHLPNYLQIFANFDGAHYTKIARIGYYQFSQAFFPGYILLLIFFGTILFQNHIIAGILISNLSFIFAIWFFSLFLKNIHVKQSTIDWIILFIIFFPTSFFFQSVYTESLFFLLVSLSFYFASSKKYWLSSIAATVSSFVRITGVLVAIPLFFLNGSRSKKFHYRQLLSASAFIGLAVYMAYLWKMYGDPLLFFHVQPSFGANRSTSLILLPQVYFRYIKIFLTVPFSYLYLTSVIECVSFTLVAAVCVLQVIRYYKLNNQFLTSLSLFSLSNILIPTVTGTFGSIPRYALLSISLFLFLAQINNKIVKITILSFFVLAQCALWSLFVLGYFVA